MTSRHQSIVQSWDQFAQKYSKLHKSALKADGTGFLQQTCTVTVHEHGEQDGVKVYYINGVDPRLAAAGAITVSSVDDLVNSFPSGFFDSRPAWCKVRWIDVEGMNGQVVQFLLRQVNCERQYTFNHIVDLKQRCMGIALDNEDEDADTTHKFLMISKVPSLTAAALKHAEDDSQPLFNVCIPGTNKEVPVVIDYEQITYLLHLEVGRETLITFQEGKAGDVFGEVREALRSSATKIHTRGAAFLLLHLIRASTESAVGIGEFVGIALDQLSTAMAEQPESLELVAHARHLESECETMHRLIRPFADTLTDLVGGVYPKEVMGLSRSGWHSINIELRRLMEDMSGEKARASALAQEYRDNQAKRQEEVQRRMETSQNIMGIILSVFTPISFLSGLYGMNFVKSDGSPAIPELIWGFSPSDPNDPTSHPVFSGVVSGYGYFWILASSAVTVTVSVYMLMGLIYTPLDAYRALVPAAAPVTAAKPSEESRSESVSPMAPPNQGELSTYRDDPVDILNDDSIKSV